VLGALHRVRRSPPPGKVDTVLPMTVWCNRLGLIVSFIGSLVIAWSVGQLPSEAYQIDEQGRKIQIAAFRRNRFVAGVILLAIGFAILFAASFIPGQE